MGSILNKQTPAFRNYFKFCPASGKNYFFGLGFWFVSPEAFAGQRLTRLRVLLRRCNAFGFTAYQFNPGKEVGERYFS